jgi:hypothetical protein
VAEAETGRAPEVIVKGNAEVAGGAAVALMALHVVLAIALPGRDVAAWPVAAASLHHALARLAAGVARIGEVPVVGRTLVTLLPRHAWLALALAVLPALQGGGTCNGTLSTALSPPPHRRGHSRT